MQGGKRRREEVGWEKERGQEGLTREGERSRRSHAPLSWECARPTASL